MSDVTGCSDCPFQERYAGDFGEYCHIQNDLPGNDHNVYTGDNQDGAPDWCPLRNGPITIRLKP